VAFIKATREKINLRAAILGPAGSGKTLNALYIAKGLGGRTAFIDTEHGSARRYANMFDFDTDEISEFSPERYERAIHEAERARYNNLIVDSLSHAWAGKGGILEFVDAAKESGNKFGAWRNATPKHNSLVETMLATPLNIIITMRVKMDYVLEPDERGRMVPRKVGLQPIQRDGVEYEFDLICDVDLTHTLRVSKSRFFELADKVWTKPDEEIGRIIKEAITSGVAPADPAMTAGKPRTQRAAFDADALIEKYGVEDILAACGGTLPTTDDEWSMAADALENQHRELVGEAKPAGPEQQVKTGMAPDTLFRPV
jgi:hypothetical protein